MLSSPTNFQRLSRLFPPAFSLSVNGVPSNIALRDRLVSLNVTLNNGLVNDQLELTLDDRSQLLGGDIAFPEPEASISVSLGYGIQLENMGVFEVNQVTLSGNASGRLLTVVANPVLLYHDDSRTWSGETINTIVSEIAQRHNLTAKVSRTLQNITVASLNQQNESDSAFLTRLAHNYNAVCKVMAGNLLFMKKGEGTSVSGLPMPAVTIPHHDIINWQKTVSQQQDYFKVVAGYHDHRSAGEQEVTVTKGQSINPAISQGRNDISLTKLPHLYASEAEARHAATTKLDELQRYNDRVSITLLGNQRITAEGKISLSGVRSQVNGDYIVERVSHSFSRNGYQTNLQAYVEPA